MDQEKFMSKLVKGPLVLYEQMRLKVLELIEERELKPHDPVPSEGELAELFGVSRRTGKEALLALAKEGVVYRLPRRGTFLAEKGRETSGTGGVSRRRLLSMVVPVIDDFVGQVMEAALQTASSAGYELIFRISGERPDQEEELLRELASDRGVEGIILFPGDRKTCSNEVLRLHLAGYPIVIVDRIFREIEIPAVCHDHYQGAYDLTSYLIDRGHRHIGFVSEEVAGVMSREERYRGYMQAHLDHGIPVNRNAIFTECLISDTGKDRNVPDAGEEAAALETFIRDNRPITAVFCSNDYVAMQTMNIAHRLSIKVPDELSVAGFTDVPVARRLAVPLTTVRKPAGDLGRSGVDLLMKRIALPQTPPESVHLPTRLMIRESVSDRLLTE